MIIHGLNNINELPEGEIHLVIGTFDGVHRGHQKIIDKAIEEAHKSDGISVVLTFWPHPTTYLRPEPAIPTIMSSEVKTHFLEEHGVDIVIQEKFTDELAHTSAIDFIKLLKRSFPSLKAIYANEKFRFGHNREGNIEFLKRAGETYGFDVYEQDTVFHKGKIVSSSRIREALQEGKIEEANEMLGYPYYCTGMVIDKNGTKKDYPTLDIVWRPELKPKYGVYAVKVRTGKKGKEFKGIANYGESKDENTPMLQIHLFEANEWGPGDFLTVEWLRFIRPEQNFESVDALNQQMKKDIEEAEDTFRYLF